MLRTTKKRRKQGEANEHCVLNPKSKKYAIPFGVRAIQKTQQRSDQNGYESDSHTLETNDSELGSILLGVFPIGLLRSSRTVALSCSDRRSQIFRYRVSQWSQRLGKKTRAYPEGRSSSTYTSSKSASSSKPSATFPSSVPERPSPP